MTLPFASLCLLTYNRSAILPRSIESLLAQSHRDFELVINDDNSPDDTERVCREYAAKDPRVRYHRNPRNLRFAGNQNAALGRASSDYVAIMHDGDIYRPDIIERWLQALVRQPAAALAFNASDSIDEQGRVIARHRHPFGEEVPGRLLFDHILRRVSSPIYGIVMVRKSAVAAAGPFDERIPTFADVDMWMRLLLRGDAAYIDEPLFQISPREAGHHNRLGNWRMTAEQETFFGWNAARRFPRLTPEARETWGQCRRTLRRARARALLACAKRGLWRGLYQGIGYCLSRPLPDPWATPAP